MQKNIEKIISSNIFTRKNNACLKSLHHLRRFWNKSKRNPICLQLKNLNTMKVIHYYEYLLKQSHIK